MVLAPATDSFGTVSILLFLVRLQLYYHLDFDSGRKWGMTNPRGDCGQQGKVAVAALTTLTGCICVCVCVCTCFSFHRHSFHFRFLLPAGWQ